MRRHKAPAGRIAYVDGRYLPHGSASVHVEDRGLQFADAVYEVFALRHGRLLDEEGHVVRLERSLSEIGMAMPMPPRALGFVLREVVRRGRLADGLVYLQVTRGAYKRDHPIPPDAQPTLIITARGFDYAAFDQRRAAGIAVVTRPDIRWGRCDIKATGLLPNIMSKSEARAAGAYEAWLVDREGFITEGTSTNAWIVTRDDVVVTRHLSSNILAGVTRAAVMAGLKGAGMALEERAFTPAEALAAREAFITSATGGVLPVVRIDGQAVGEGKPGPIGRRLHAIYQEMGA